jgi:hypothetical protein
MQGLAISTPPATQAVAPPPPPTANPFAAPPAYPQSTTKSEFDSEGIEFLRPLRDKGELKQNDWLNERAAYPIDSKTPPPASPVSTYASHSRTPSNPRISYVPPGPPPPVPTPAPSQQMWAPPPHDPEYGRQPYQEPELEPKRFGPAFIYRRYGFQGQPGQPGRLSKGLKIFSEWIRRSESLRRELRTDDHRSPNLPHVHTHWHGVWRGLSVRQTSFVRRSLLLG